MREGCQVNNKDKEKRGILYIDIATPKVLVILVAVAFVLWAFLLFGIPPGPSREGARRATCISNLKHLAMALHLYSSDYDGHLPSSALVNGSKKWNKQDFLQFATKAGQLPPKGAAHTWPQLIHKHAANKDAIFCPEDKGDHDTPVAQVSYWWRLAVDKAWYGEGCAKKYRKIDDYPSPSRTVILYEHQPWHDDSQPEPQGLSNGVYINVAHLDGHVKRDRVRNATSGSKTNCAANSDGWPMYFNFDKIRDPGQNNPPPENAPAKYVDPGRYADKGL